MATCSRLLAIATAAIAAIGCSAPAVVVETPAPSKRVEATSPTPMAKPAPEHAKLGVGDLVLGSELPPASCRDLFFRDAPVWIVAHGKRGDAGIQALVKYCLAQASKRAPALRLAALDALEAEAERGGPTAALDHLAAGYLAAELAYEAAESYGSSCMWCEQSRAESRSYALADFEKRLGEAPAAKKALAHFRAATASDDEVGWFATLALLRLSADIERPAPAALDALARRPPPHDFDPDARRWLIDATSAWRCPDAERAFRAIELR